MQTSGIVELEIEEFYEIEYTINRSEALAYLLPNNYVAVAPR